MNDRFKFRFWNKKEKEYFTCGDIDHKSGIFKTYPYRTYNWCFEHKNIIAEQCTGLKDKNGKLIYEGDIVEIMVWDDIEEDLIETKGKVYWSKEDAAFLIFVSYDGEYSLNSQETFYGQEIKVIGNIHENTDLIKVGGK